MWIYGGGCYVIDVHCSYPPKVNNSFNLEISCSKYNLYLHTLIKAIPLPNNFKLSFSSKYQSNNKEIIDFYSINKKTKLLFN